jgi:hypothetical protein
VYANPLTRWLLPRWYAMARRTRYREPHFIPDPRVLVATGRKPLSVEPEKPKPQHKLLVKPPDEPAADEGKTGKAQSRK